MRHLRAFAPALAAAWVAVLTGCAAASTAHSADALALPNRALVVDPSAPRRLALTASCSRAGLEVRAVWVAVCAPPEPGSEAIDTPLRPIETATIWLGGAAADAAEDVAWADGEIARESEWTLDPDLVGPRALESRDVRPTLAVTPQTREAATQALCEAGPADGMPLRWESPSGQTGAFALDAAGRAFVASPANTPTLLRGADGEAWYVPACGSP